MTTSTQDKDARIISHGLCFRCNHRAVFLETGHGPRSECKDINNATGGCYMYTPTKPLILVKDSTDKRPQFAGAIFSSRSRSGGLADCRLSLEQTKAGATPYWTPKSIDERHIKARDTLWFLGCHPATGHMVFDVMSLLDIDIVSVCKNGYAEPIKGCISMWYTPERYKKYKAEFDKEFKEYTQEELKTQKKLVRIHVPYEKVYGEKWAPDHIEYWGEMAFVVYVGKDFNKEHDRTKWQTMSGIETSGRSFEELIINVGIEFKKIFGNFDHDKVLTQRERLNNKGKLPFVFKKVKGNDRGRSMHPNKSYIRVGPAEENRRWLKWFSKTPYCKKNWSKTVKAILEGKEQIF